jgi:hypothetical protein
MKVTATIAGKLIIAAIAGWGFGVVITQPFIDNHGEKNISQPGKPSVYKLVQQNADWNKLNTVRGLDKIPGCSYVYEDVSKNPNVKCKLPCISLYKGTQLIYRWEGNIMMKNDVTIQKIQQEMK